MKSYIALFITLVVLATSVSAESANYYKKAQKLVGLHEAIDTEKLTKLLSVNPVQVPWCGYFLTYIFDGKDKLDNPGLARNWLSVGTSTDTPKKGDLVIFERNNSSWQGHVGFYVDEYRVNGIDYIAVLGGNQNDSVRYSLYKKTNVLGYRQVSF